MKPSYPRNSGELFHSILIGTIALFGLSSTISAQAQIVPDNTLPENSRVTPQGNILVINGGTEAGGNLFHSFAEFSLPTGTAAYLNNASTVDNIISRVTSNSISNIDGLIKANGNANLFFLNPNGIVFGPNATLDIGGSFLATTAESIRFSDGSEFSATNPTASPLLTVSVPIGLQLGENSGAIQVQGPGHSLSFAPQFQIQGAGESPTGLRIKPGQTLALVGRNVIFDRGIVTAPQGRIELGSVDSGLVSLKPTAKGWTLGYEEVTSFQDIQLSQQSLADATGKGSGSIQIQGANVAVTDGSAIILQNQGVEPGGRITIKASESLEVSGDKLGANGMSFPSTVASGTVETDAALETGDGGDIILSTRKLTLGNGGLIITDTLAKGARGGDVQINASDSLEIIGFSPINSAISSNLVTLTSRRTSGNAGNVSVSTTKLTILDGGAIGSATVVEMDGSGSAGEVTINATESVELAGVNPDILIPSALGSYSLSSKANAGSLTINTAKLVVRDGARVETANQGSGSLGTLLINATESIEITGEEVGATTFTLIGSRPEIPGFVGSAEANSGNVIINTPQLRVTDGAEVTVSNSVAGDAGTITVNAGSIFLDRQGGITAASNGSGEAGKIILNVQDTLNLRHDSLIGAPAKRTGNGGDIDINAKFIIAVPRENSNITANAFQGRGGNINITTQGIFGLEPRGQLTPLSDINASSELGVEGAIEINTLEVDPTKELVELPEEIVNVARLIDQNLCAVSQGSEFTITGRSGLPNSPGQALSTDDTWEDWRLPEAKEPQTESRTIPPSTPSQIAKNSGQERVLEFQGWAVNSRGNIVLTAQANIVTSQGNWLPSPGCQL